MKANYIQIANSEIEPESPFTNSLATRLRDNPIAIAQISQGAPEIAQKIETQLLAGSGTWVVPADVYSVRIYMSGGGGGGCHASSVSQLAASGGSTSFMGTTVSGGVPGRFGSGATFNVSATNERLHGAPGGRGFRNGSNGGAGQSKVFVVSVEPGQSYSYSIGSGGLGSELVGQRAGRGANGFIRLEY